MHAIVDPVVWTEFCSVSPRSRQLSPLAEGFREFLRNQGPGDAARAA